MLTSGRPFSGYDSGADFWYDNAVNYGMDEAAVICGSYLDMQLKADISDSERQFCRELFTAMYDAASEKTAVNKPVYAYDFQEANERGESSNYYGSRRLNGECAKGISEIISNSCYRANFYNLEIAALIAILKYGFTRVNLVLAFNIQKHIGDGRYSSANKQWAQAFTVPERAFNDSYLSAHACLVDGFTDYVRKLQV
jgi:hypothetical protein